MGNVYQDVKKRQLAQIQADTAAGKEALPGRSGDPEIQAAIEKQRRNYEQIQRGKQFDKALGKYDETQGKFFEQMRQGFRQRSQSIASGQLTTGTSAINQSMARAGLGFSGVQQAALTGLYGQVGAAQTQAQSEYDQRLNELQQTQRDAFVRGEFDFFNQLQAMSYQHDLDKELASFQAELADKYSSGWNDFFNVLGQAAGMFGGSYLQAWGTAAGTKRGG